MFLPNQINQIVDIKNNKKYSIFSKNGKQLLKQYLKFFLKNNQKGGIVSARYLFDNEMMEKTTVVDLPYDLDFCNPLYGYLEIKKTAAPLLFFGNSKSFEWTVARTILVAINFGEINVIKDCSDNLHSNSDPHLNIEVSEICKVIGQFIGHLLKLRKQEFNESIEKLNELLLEKKLFYESNPNPKKTRFDSTEIENEKKMITKEFKKRESKLEQFINEVAVNKLDCLNNIYKIIFATKGRKVKELENIWNKLDNKRLYNLLSTIVCFNARDDKDLEQYSKETVQMFLADATKIYK